MDNSERFFDCIIAPLVFLTVPPPGVLLVPANANWIGTFSKRDTTKVSVLALLAEAEQVMYH